ncbi:single-stranded-DNA-specific exonuclease RecJ [Desulfocapsa sulfexigens DSM 10523]|uniref:Single-stranded-DNA-specific exonuclease RecJ n=1 Tax=Desulfocapsa sulfexigens (strain DSM 10523 / SB164P1) TaxID=1167006 RepID=M1P7H0_DESSD|nr:single-stranded-DNA-specific exonuclease RecJ [Desulfocapsa sulfexigens]AGF79413.1 single-stranded-DNA-specific exonuclease RecJ [Desulfocapsa sulfexigens DSM 10523]
MSVEQGQKRIRLSDGKYLNPFIEKLLARRGICGKDEIQQFLEPKLKELPSPFLLKDMDLAVNLIEETITNGHPILVWGDYDVDGTTATALLLLFFKSIGYTADYHIPNRLTDGYGIQKDGLRKVSENRDTDKCLLITVDNGISAHEAVEYAKKLGYKVIITDHHLALPERVMADAVINPNQTNCEFLDKTLAGVGVAFYLAMATRTHLLKCGYFDTINKPPNLKQFLDLVAIGTIADMVPLKKINRIMVKAGMETIGDQKNHGITALCHLNNLDPKCIRSEDVSFQLAPKINAAGRMGEADKAIKLFLSLNKKEAFAIAKDLVESNDKRKLINIKDFISAKDNLLRQGTNTKHSIIVAGNYHVGVAGIVASNLVEEYQKPSVVLCDLGEGVLKGSARSVVGIDIFKALDNCREVLLGFGGHEMAGGMSLLKGNLMNFKKLFDESIQKQSNRTPENSDNQIDDDIEINDLFNGEILRQLHLMEPFGTDNPQPIFRDRSTEFLKVLPLGRDKSHLRFNFRGERHTIEGVGFGMGKLIEHCRLSKERDILYTPSINFFKGKRSWQVRVTKIVFNNDNIPDSQHN